MASLTTRCGLNMVTRFSFGRCPIMAIRTTSINAGMVHRRASETISAFVAGFSTYSGLNMVTRFAFSC